MRRTSDGDGHQASGTCTHLRSLKPSPSGGGWPGNCLDWGGSLLGFGNIFFLLFSAALPLGPCDIAVLGWTLQLVMVEQGGFILQG